MDRPRCGGGFIGSALGVTFAKLFEIMTADATGAPRFPVQVDLELLAGTTLLATGVGLIAAVIPARRAARLDPAAAIRGQQQRVAIARAMVRRPPLVLADEPTGNLDTASADDVFELMRRFNREHGTSFLVVTHDPRIAARCERVIEIVDGRITSDTSQSA
jgi:predicted ABC-type transport system involved in lysophospholipase L1 biosynthesis ATPase subunit